MRAYWILPNRGQRDDVLASDGQTILPLRQILDPKLRPEGFSHGVPAEILEKCGPKAVEKILFAQRFPEWNGGKQLFCVSSPAGADGTGRVVHLGLLFILDPHERPRFELSYRSLAEEDQTYASALLHRMASPRDSWAQSVRELSELPTASGPSTNVALHRSVVRFHSLYDASPAGLTRTAAIWKSLATTVILLIFLAVVGAWLSARACERSSRADVQTGVILWRFN